MGTIDGVLSIAALLMLYPLINSIGGIFNKDEDEISTVSDAERELNNINWTDSYTLNATMLSAWNSRWVSHFTKISNLLAVEQIKAMQVQAFETYVKPLADQVPIIDPEPIIEDIYTPVIVRRGAYSFTAYTEEQERLLKDFLGIEPSGLDIDSYLITLDNTALAAWASYWAAAFVGYPSMILSEFIQQKYRDNYDQPVTPPTPIVPIEYPKMINSGVGLQIEVYNYDQEVAAKDFFGISPAGPDYITYLQSIGRIAAFQQWRPYWVEYWNRLGRPDIAGTVVSRMLSNAGY